MGNSEAIADGKSLTFGDASQFGVFGGQRNT